MCFILTLCCLHKRLQIHLAFNYFLLSSDIFELSKETEVKSSMMGTQLYRLPAVLTPAASCLCFAVLLSADRETPYLTRPFLLNLMVGLSVCQNHGITSKMKSKFQRFQSLNEIILRLVPREFDFRKYFWLFKHF